MADLVTIEALQRAGVHVTDGSQALLEARKIKSTADEIALPRPVGRFADAVYDEIYRMLRPAYEHEIAACAHQLLFEMARAGGGGQRRQETAATRIRTSSRQAPTSGRSGVLRHHPFVHGVPHVLLPHVQRRWRQSRATERTSSVENGSMMRSRLSVPE